MNRSKRWSVVCGALLCVLTSMFDLSRAESADVNARQPFTFRAEWFSGGDMVLRGLPYSDKYVALSPGSNPSDSRADFELDFPESGDYALDALYSACDSRPLALEFDGRVVLDRALGGVNGSWLTSESTWERQLTLENVAAGKHVLTVRAHSPDIPHFSAFRLTPLFDMTKPWSVPRALAKKKIQDADSWRPSPWSGGWYEYIARDRYERKESGETFSDHYARETTLALAPRSSETILASTKPFGADAVAVDLFDELTYAPGMFASSESSDSA